MQGVPVHSLVRELDPPCITQTHYKPNSAPSPPKKKEHTRKNVEGGKENLIEASGSDILEIMNGLVPLKYCLGICFSNP